jgi:hypothetical protein
MRWFVALVLILCSALLAGYIFLKGYPYKLYSNWVMGHDWNRYYRISNYDRKFLKPLALDELEDYEEDYPQLWKEFPLRNVMVPLPTRHPLYQILPVIELKNKDASPTIGVTFINSRGRDISRIYTIPTSLLPDYSLGQDLFKLPFVRNRIMKRNLDELWKDIFSHDIVVKSKSLDEMIYDLYLLHIRSKFLPKGTIRYGLIRNGNQAVIELSGPDKDYKVELVMTQNSGSIYSFLLKTEKGNKESMKLRSKLLQTVSFSPPDAAMGRILYTEFKQLNFARQVDEEGMLYLFAAWSQDPLEVEFLKEMIFYLERGKKTRILSLLYEYAYHKYGKTFTTRNLFTEQVSPEITLQRKIEIEALEKKMNAGRTETNVPQEPKLTPEEKMNMYLKKARESAPEQKDDMTLH